MFSKHIYHWFYFNRKSGGHGRSTATDFGKPPHSMAQNVLALWLVLGFDAMHRRQQREKGKTEMEELKYAFWGIATLCAQLESAV